MSWSIWEQEMIRPEADVIVVGSGITGLSTAWFISHYEPSLDILVIDRSAEGAGASTRNAGFACMGSLGELVSDAGNMSVPRVMDLYLSRWQGLQILTDIIPEKEMDLHWCGGYELFFEGQEKEWENVRDQINTWNDRIEQVTGISENFSLCGLDRIESWHPPGHLIGAIKHKKEGRLHPGKMIRAWLDRLERRGIRVKSGVNIESLSKHENSVVLQDQLGRNWKAGKVVLATNAFTRSLLPQFDIQPARNQVIVSQPLERNIPDACFHVDQGYIYFRRWKDRLLIGGARNFDLEGETTADMAPHPGVIQRLREFASRLLGEPMEVSYHWSGIIGVGAEKLPIVRSVDENIVLAARLSGMGVALGSAIGQEAARLIVGKT